MKTIHAVLVLAMSAGLVIVDSARADDPTHLREVTKSPERPQTRSIKDVVLQDGGVLTGRFVDDGGVPVDGARLVVRQKDRVASVVITDARGEFAAKGLTRGVYRIESPTATADYRVWEADEAPPSARPIALLVSQNPTLRGQYGYRTLDLITLGLGAGGVTLGVLALDKADDAEARAIQAEQTADEYTPVSP